ncbi:unnamed protein product, partial [Prorocentrum cordatum]
DTLASDPNSVFFRELIEAIQCIKDHRVFQDINTADGYGLPSSAHADPGEVATGAGLNPTNFVHSIEASGTYSCYTNLFLIDLTAVQSKQVPISRNKIRELQDHFFSQPTSTWPLHLSVAVRSNQRPPNTHWGPGCCSLLTAPEVAWAYVLSVAESIKNGATDPELAPWYTGLLAAPMKFCRIDNEQERYWAHLQSREDLVQMAESVKRSPIERGFDVMEARVLLDSGKELGAKECAGHWAKNVRLAKSSEPISVSFVDAVFTIWKRAMGVPHLKALVMRFETELSRSPWDSIYKLEAVVKRCSTTANITWALSVLFDALKNGLLTAPEIALRQLQGKGMPGNKGILDLFMAKKDVAEAMFKLGNEKGLNNSLLTKMDSWRTSMDNYRNDVGYWDGAAKSYTVNNHWIMALPQSAQKFLKIWEEAVALCEHNDALKQRKISDLTVNEGFLNKKPISDRLESIWEELAEENGGKPSGDEDGNSKLQLAEVDDMEIEDAVMVSKVSRTVALASDSEGRLRKWADYARQKVNRVVKLEVHPGTVDGVARIFKESALSLKVEANCATTKDDFKKMKYITVIYDTKLSGSATARAHLRIVNFRESHQKTGIKGIMTGAGDQNSIADNLMFFVLDGQQHGHETKLMKAFVDENGRSVTKEKKTIYVACSESSLRKRRARVRGSVSLSCVEFCHIVTHKPLALPEKTRLHFPGATHSDLLGPFDVPDNSSVWLVPQKDKAEIYGPAMVESGGSIPGDDAQADPAPKPTDRVPLTYWSNGSKMYEELDHGANSGGWVDLTCIDEYLAMLCIRQQKPYLGYCPTEKHRSMLSDRLECLVFDAFQTVGDSLYEAGLAELVNPDGNEEEPAAEQEDEELAE